jgi:hypothetical protein
MERVGEAQDRVNPGCGGLVIDEIKERGEAGRELH